LDERRGEKRREEERRGEKRREEERRGEKRREEERREGAVRQAAGTHLGDEGLGMLLEVISEMLSFQSDLLHLTQSAAFHHKAITFGIKEESIRCSTLCHSVLYLLLKSSVSQAIAMSAAERDIRGEIER
jgi:hypothetical protein